MTKLFKKLLVRAANIAINTQLVISPMALSQDNTTQTNAWDKVANAAQAIGSVAQTGMQLINKNQSNSIINQYRLQLINPLQSHPAISANGCLTYEAKGNTPPTENLCPLNPSQENSQLAAQLFATAKININDLDNYQTNGNESQTSQGAACLNKAALDYQQKLKARLKELDNFEKFVENSVTGFKEAMEQNLKSIKRNNALLNGRSNDEENSLADYDFGKEFGNQSCSTFINQNEIESVGDQGGYRALENLMNERFEGSSNDSDNYSPKALLTNERQIRSDVERVLENFNNNIVGTDSIELDAATLYDGAQPKLLDLENQNLSNVVNNELKEFSRDLRDKKKSFRSNVDDETLTSIENGTENSSEIARIYRRNQYNACLANYIGDSRSFARSITNYTLSDAANKDRDSILRTEVYENLEDNEIDIDQKIANISSFDNSGQEKIRLRSTQVLCGKTIYKDATNVSVSSLISLYKCECERIYNSRNGGTISASETEAEIAGYTQYIADQKSKLMSTIGNKVKEKILFCTDDVTTGVGALSCTNAFEKSSNNFCLATAQRCASQVGSCLQTINQKLVQTRNEQVAIAGVYNNAMNDLKRSLEINLQASISKIEETALYDDANNKTGSLVKTTLNLKMDQLKDKFIEGLDDSLQMEDPDAYLEIMKADIKIARDTLKQSNNELFGGDVEGFSQLASSTGATSGLLGKIASYLDNVEKEKERWQRVYDQCSASIDAINQQRQDQNLRNQEQNAKRQQQYAYNLKKCQILENGCEKSLYDFATNVTQVAGTIDGSSTRNPYKELCTSNKSTDSDEIAADLLKNRDIYVQQIKIENYCKSGKVKSEHREKCHALFPKEEKKEKNKEDIKFCKGYEEKDLYADNKFCILYAPEELESLNNKIQGIPNEVENEAECEKINPQKLKRVYSSYSAFKNFTNGKNKRESAVSKIKPKCITPEDNDYKSLASAAYIYYANKSPEFSGYGESRSAQDCKTIIANSTGSGEKDEGWATGISSLLNGLNSGSNIIQK